MKFNPLSFAIMSHKARLRILRRFAKSDYIDALFNEAIKNKAPERRIIIIPNTKNTLFTVLILLILNTYL